MGHARGDVSMEFSVDMFYKIPHNNKNHTKPYVVHVLIRNYHLQFDPKLGQGKCEIRHIPCVYNSCTDHLDFLWIPTYSDDKKTKVSASKTLFSLKYIERIKRM